MKFNFYYDETEHSRVINYSTITGATYYDNFISAIIGWDSNKESAIEEKYLKFEEKYQERKRDGELKSETFKAKRFKYGFASFNKQNVELLDDYLSVFNDNFYIYICLKSKLEYIIFQLFKDYKNSLMFDMDALKYSIVKVLITYRPKEVLRSLYSTPKKFVDSLIDFFTDRIVYNKKNLSLKILENEALENILLMLKDVETPSSIEWDYKMSFIGFKKYLQNKRISDYSLIIDKEGEIGEKSKTLIAAIDSKLDNCSEGDSKVYFGIRVADMLVGVMGKLMKSLFFSLHREENNQNVTQNLLDIKWFKLSEEQLGLYKKLYKIVCCINEDWYKMNFDNYADDLICFIALLEFFNHYESVDQLQADLESLPKLCNAFMCEKLKEHFAKMRIKVPVEPIITDNDEFFLNQKGAKVYFDTKRQPTLCLKDGTNKFRVLSVGTSNLHNPMITIENDGKAECYKLPMQLSDWAMTLTGYSMMGENLLPADIVFTKENDNYFADVL